MTEHTPRYPQELVADVISYLERLERKGIRSVYLSDDAGGATRSTITPPDEEPGTNEPRNDELSSATTTETALAELREQVSVCTQCALHETRTNTVFGEGNTRTKVMFIGEAPGHNEDVQGEPFVGRAGQLLTKILEAIDLKREDVFITNILKCRPPDNRDPQESEVRCCEKYLKTQIDLIKPRFICALGRIAAQWLLQTSSPLSTLRTGEYYYEGIRILPTYHPAALLRNPNFKKPAWEDFKKLKSLLDELD